MGMDCPDAQGLLDWSNLGYLMIVARWGLRGIVPPSARPAISHCDPIGLSCFQAAQMGRQMSGPQAGSEMLTAAWMDSEAPRGWLLMSM